MRVTKGISSAASDEGDPRAGLVANGEAGGDDHRAGGTAVELADVAEGGLQVAGFGEREGLRHGAQRFGGDKPVADLDAQQALRGIDPDRVHRTLPCLASRRS